MPFALTIDFQTVQDRTVTIRERDTTSQIRLPVRVPPTIAFLTKTFSQFLFCVWIPYQMEKAAPVISSLVSGQATWAEVQQQYPKFEQQQLQE